MHSNQFEEVNRQFQEAFTKIRSSGIKGDIDQVESLVSTYLQQAQDPTVSTLMLQLILNKIIHQLPKIDNLMNHQYLSMAKSLHKLEMKKEKQPDVELNSPPGLSTDFQNRKMVREENSFATSSDMTETPFIEDKKEEEEEKQCTCNETLEESIDKLDLSSYTKCKKLSEITRISREIATKLIIEKFSDLKEDNQAFKRASTRISKRIHALNEVKIDYDINKDTKFTDSNEFFRYGLNHMIKNGTSIFKKPTSAVKVGKIKGLDMTLLSKSDEPTWSHLVTSDQEGNVHHHLKLEKPQGFHDDVVVTKTVAKNPNIQSPVKMHDIYHHLINSGFVLMSDKTQSPGGLEVWKNLSKMPNVNVHGWDTKKNIPINSDEHLEDTEDTHRKMWDVLAGDEHGLSVHNDIRLIAHKKDLNESVLNEIYMLPYGKGQKFEDDIFYGHSGINDARDYLGSFSKEEDLGKLGHLNVSRFEDPNTQKGRILTHDESGKIHHVLTYERPYEEAPKTLKIKSITANDKGDKSIGAHELYHHMLNRGHMIQSDDSQTEGGLHVWNRLSEKPGVHIHAWDTSTDNAVDTPNPVEHARNNPHVILLAHK